MVIDKKEINRREKITKYLDMLDNKQQKYLEEMIINRLNTEEAKEFVKYSKTDNFTNQIITAESILFQEPIVIDLMSKGGENPIANNEDFKVLHDSLLFNATMQEVNKKVNLTKDVAVVVQIVDEKVELSIVTSDMLLVGEKENDPTKFEWIAYQVGKERNDDYIDLKIYHKWSKEGKFEIKINASGKIIEEILLKDAPDYGGRIPVVMFRNYIQADSFFKDFNSEVVGFNEALNYNMTRTEMERDYNLPQKVIVGGEKDKRYSMGITFIEVFDQGMMGGDLKPSISYARPDFPIKEEMDATTENKKQFATSKGLSQDTISGGDFTSGYELLLSKTEIINLNKAQRPFYAKSIKDLIDIIILAAAITNQFIVTEEYEVSLDFGEIKYSDDPQKKASTRQTNIAIGIASRIDYIMEDNPDLDRAAAEAKARQIDKDNLKSSTIGDNIPPAPAEE